MFKIQTTGAKKLGKFVQAVAVACLMIAHTEKQKQTGKELGADFERWTLLSNCSTVRSSFSSSSFSSVFVHFLFEAPVRSVCVCCLFALSRCWWKLHCRTLLLVCTLQWSLAVEMVALRVGTRRTEQRNRETLLSLLFPFSLFLAFFDDATETLQTNFEMVFQLCGFPLLLLYWALSALFYCSRLLSLAVSVFVCEFLAIVECSGALMHRLIAT